MNMTTALAIIGALALGMIAFGRDGSAGEAPKVLVAYFSKTGNTRALAEQVHARVGGDLFRVEPLNPYPGDYRETTDVARRELDRNARPALAAAIPPEAMREYDVIFLGYPCWWGTLPMAMFTFLEGYDLSGKTIIPFTTHGGSGLARGPGDIGEVAPGATVRQGLAVRSASAGDAGREVEAWLRQLGYLQ